MPMLAYFDTMNYNESMSSVGFEKERLVHVPFAGQILDQTRLSTIPWLHEPDLKERWAQDDVIMDRLTQIKAVLPDDNQATLKDTHNKTLENYAKLALVTAENSFNLERFIRVFLRVFEQAGEQDRALLAPQMFHIWAPAAEVAGFFHLKDDLQNYAFNTMYPEEVRKIHDAYSYLGGNEAWDTFLGSEVAGIQGILDEGLGAPQVTTNVDGRKKSAYSIWRKVQADKRSSYVLSDFLGVRVTLASDDEEQAEAACYKAEKLVAELYEPAKGRRKDYIATPKPNGYKSIHQTCILPDSTMLEIQIRTKTMHEAAENDPNMSHMAYDALKLTPGRNSSKKPVHRIYSWRDEAARLIREQGGVTKEILGNKMLIMNDHGNVFELEIGETALDGAFRIHSGLASRAIRVTKNGIPCSLDTPLKHGDNLWFTYGAQDRWTRDWLKYTRSDCAHTWLKRACKKLDQESLYTTGTQKLAAFMVANQFEGSLELLSGDRRSRLAVELGFKTFETLMREIGYRTNGRGLGIIAREINEIHRISPAPSTKNKK
jgi:(p)ppGpp synthase/HD superfamily hydrolase